MGDVGEVCWSVWGGEGRRCWDVGEEKEVVRKCVGVWG